MVDAFWHSHILDTAAYHSTCVHLFGQYVHHKPHARVMQKKTYWAARAKHFPRDAGDGDEDDGADSDSTEADEGEDSDFGCG